MSVVVKSIKLVTETLQVKSPVLIRRSRRSELSRVRLVADLEIPAVRIIEVEALELAVHVGLRIQAPLFEFLLHFGSVPWLDTPRDVVDQTGDSRLIRASRCACVSRAISDDDAAHIADLHRALLLAVVVNDLPSHQVAIESGASPVVGDSVGDVIEPHRLPRRWGPLWRNAVLFRRLLRRHERSRSGRHGKSKRLDQLPARQLPSFKILQQSADDLLHRTLLGSAFAQLTLQIIPFALQSGDHPIVEESPVSSEPKQSP